MGLVLAVLAIVGAAVPAAGSGGPSARAWHLSVAAPAQFELVLAEVRLPGGVGRPRHVSVRGPVGLELVAGAFVRRPPSGGPATLVVVINRRPRGSSAPDPKRIGVTVTAPRSGRAPSLRAASSPLVRAIGGVRPAICRLGTAGRPLAASALQAILAAGQPVPGYGVAATVAQAYDLVCGLPHDPAFVSAAVGGCPTSLVAGCCPPNAQCAVPAPSPAPPPPPAPAPVMPPSPACPPCPPCRGHACPLVPMRIACLAPAAIRAPC